LPIDTLTLLQPLRLDATFTGEEAIPLRALLTRLASTVEQSPDLQLPLLRALHDELCQMPFESLPDQFETGTNLKRSSVVELDDYMHVIRVDAVVPAAVWLRSMVEAQLGWLHLVDKGGGESADLKHVAAGFQVMHQVTARALETHLAVVGVHPAVLQPQAATFDSHELLEIWRKGHWIFFVLTQALTIVFKRLVRALHDESTASARTELAAAIELFWASGASMKLTGAFSNEQYHSDVRPTMTLGDDRAVVKTTSLSGAMTWDHHYLVNRVWREGLMPLLGTLPLGVQDLYPEFLRAYREGLSTGHRAVCAKFGGESMGSLVAPNHIAVNLLDSIEATRLAQLSLQRNSKPSPG
jgi:hypothetical protein